MNKPLTKALVLICCIIIVLISCNDSKNSTKDKPDAEASPKETTTIKEDNPKTSVAETQDCCIHVDADKTNILYIGVDNPITIQAPNEVEVSLSGEGTISKADSIGKYIVKVNGGREAYIIVKHLRDTSCRLYKKFRVKRVPDPVAYVGGIKADGVMTKAEAANIRGVFARVENFDFDLKFNVVSFVLSMNINGVYVESKSNGPGVTGDMSRLLSSARAGTKILFEQIMVSGPDGTLRKIPGVIIKVR